MATAPPVGGGNDLRKLEMSRLRDYFQYEDTMRQKYYSRYKKLYNAASYTSSAMSAISLGLGAAGIGVLASIVAIPIGIGLEAGSITCATVATLSNYLQRRAQKKFEKHDEIKVLAMSKLSSIYEMVSKANVDDYVSDQEFALIMKEKEKYEQLKCMIKHSYRKKLSTLNKNPTNPSP